MRLSEPAPGSLIMCLLPRVADLRNRNIQYTHKRNGYSQGKMADFVKLIKEWLIFFKWLQNGWFCWNGYKMVDFFLNYYKMVDFVEMTTNYMTEMSYLTFHPQSNWDLNRNEICICNCCSLVCCICICCSIVCCICICCSIVCCIRCLYLLFYCVLYLYLLFSCVSARRRGKCLWQTTLQVSIVRQQT